MTDTTSPLTQALAAQAGLARRAAVLSLAGPLIWCGQAAVLSAALVGLMGQSGLAPLPAAGLFFALALLRAGIDDRALALTQRLSALVRQELRARLIAQALRLSPGGPQEDPGGLASLMGEGIAQIGPWVERFRPAALRARVIPVVILALAVPLDWAAAGALVLTGPLIPVFMALVGWAAEAASRAHLLEQGALNRVLIDRVAALIDIRLLGATAQAGQDMAARAETLRGRTMAVLRLAFLSSAVLEFFAALGVALVAVHVGLSLLGLIGWGGWGGPISPFGGIFLLLVVPEFYQPLRELASAWHDRAAAEAAAGRIAAELARPGVMLGQGRPGLAPSGLLTWSGLRIGLGDTAQIAVPDGQLAPGEAVALTGPSGVGKSAMLMALAGLVPAAGRVQLGTRSLSDASADDLRAAMALIPQAPYFPATALRLWLAPAATPDAVLWQALHRADAAGVVQALPQGLETGLGETGGGVSGGEARRLMIARALIAAPQVILADEPTADLDAQAADAVCAVLLALRDSGVALLVATHDPRLAARMDRKITLEATP